MPPETFVGGNLSTKSLLRMKETKKDIKTKRSEVSENKSKKHSIKKLNKRLERLIAAKKKKKEKKASKVKPAELSHVPKSYTCLFCNVADGSHDDRIHDRSLFVAVDCEFVGVGPGKISALGRCSIVDWDGNIICDIYAKPEERITDYRTRWSGIRPRHMKNAMPFYTAQDIIRGHLEGKFVIGHAVNNDLHVMGIPHPKDMTIDTSKCDHLKRKAKFVEHQPASLKRLSSALLQRVIQSSEHSSVEDARATMDLFRYSMGQYTVTGTTISIPVCTSYYKPKKQTDANRKSFMDDQYWPDDIYGV